MKRKAMVYTTFALLSSSILLILALVPVTSNVDIDSSSASRIGEASFFLDSILSDMDRSLELGTRRAFTESTDYIIENGTALSQPEKNISSALVNGTISGYELESMDGVTLKDWADRVSSIADNANYGLTIELEKSSINSSDTAINSSYTVFTRLKDPVTLAAFNETKTEETSVSVEGIDDPMLLLRTNGQYNSDYQDCSFDEPAEQLITANTYDEGSFHGNAAKNPSDISTVSDKDEKVLVVEDVSTKDQVEVNNYGAVVSAQPNSSSGYNNVYAFDTGSVSEIEQNMSLTVYEGQVWRSNFREMFQKPCYVQTNEGPNVLDRMENKLASNEDKTGIATFLDISELPSNIRREDSVVGYVYFNETADYGSLNNIRGVTTEYPWFKLDQTHVDKWNLNDLTY